MRAERGGGSVEEPLCQPLADHNRRRQHVSRPDRAPSENRSADRGEERRCDRRTVQYFRAIPGR